MPLYEMPRLFKYVFISEIALSMSPGTVITFLILISDLPDDYIYLNKSSFKFDK